MPTSPENRLDMLLTLVPDLQDRIASLKPALLGAILKLPLEQVADIVITLKVRYDG
jgi:hypothetical protein